MLLNGFMSRASASVPKIVAPIMVIPVPHAAIFLMVFFNFMKLPCIELNW